MDPHDLTEQFETERPRLTAIATRVLGSRADAEDVVQEAWVRLGRQEPGSIDNVPGWLTTVVGRISIDLIRSRATKAEVPLESGIPDLVVTEDDDIGASPEESALLADSVGLALLVVLGSLGPEERLAFVLHDLFAVPFVDIGTILGKSTEAAKMSASRARSKVRAAQPDTVSAERRREQRTVVDAFLAAAREGNFEALLEVLDPDLVWEVRTTRGVRTRVGAHEILDVIARSDASRVVARRVLVNGQPGILAWGPDGRPVGLMSCTVEEGRMTKVVSVVDKRWLAEQDLPRASRPQSR
ncbi:RNA polymerase subunit sigma-70 [Nocardioides sp. Soil797]|nr:RNA polymerase subunit sigma-70 [Nocardioides sp. Soil797]